MGVAFPALAVSLTVDFPIAICAAVAAAAIIIATPRLGGRQFDNMRGGPPILTSATWACAPQQNASDVISTRAAASGPLAPLCPCRRIFTAMAEIPGRSADVATQALAQFGMFECRVGGTAGYESECHHGDGGPLADPTLVGRRLAAAALAAYRAAAI